ncbi:M23 family metallopeptidase [Lachnotalea glycerini]
MDLNKIKKGIIGEILFLLLFVAIFSCKNNIEAILTSQMNTESESNPFKNRDTTPKQKKDYIKWVEFNVTSDALSTAYHYDIDSYKTDIKLDWIELLAYAASKCGGEVNKKAILEIKKAAELIKSGESTMQALTADLKYYSYYYEAYSAILDGFVGEYEIEEDDENGDKVWVKKYGLKAFSPIAKGFPYSDYDDFGVSRSYGYRRNHLGHDMMGQTGTPIIAVESGYIEALGWNQYGGWRIGIRSFNKKRYYYYAHLRQNFPYCKTLKEGDTVTAGDVIGYMGHTGYSSKENVNNINTTHLHFGLQLIFDESQKECNNEIWVDCYALTNFLSKNRSEAVKNEETKEWYRVYDMKEESTETAENAVTEAFLIKSIE